MAKEDIIEVFEADNPEYAAYNTQFHELLKELVEMMNIPAIRTESLFAYLNTSVDGAFRAKLAGMNPNMIDHRLFVVMRNGVLDGFTFFHRLPEGLPYIRTMSWPYLHARDIRTTQALCEKVMEYKTKGRMKYITGVAVHPRLAKNAERYFKLPGRSPVIGPYLLFTDNELPQ